MRSFTLSLRDTGLLCTIDVSGMREYQKMMARMTEEHEEFLLQFHLDKVKLQVYNRVHEAEDHRCVF